MPRARILRWYVGGLVAVFAYAAAAAAASAALGGCLGPEMGDVPERGAQVVSPEAARAEVGRAEGRGLTAAGQDRGVTSDDQGGERAGDGDRDGQEPEADPSETDPGAGEGAYALYPAGSDLEFSEGLAEPPQGQVLPAPAPWTPPPGADAGAKPVIEDVWPDKGPVTGGERITIRGKNLEAAQVIFGFVPARILGISETMDTLTVAAPASRAGQVPIVVTNRDGSYALSSGTFRYYD